MFKQLQGTPWYRNRPYNTGLFAVVVGLALIVVAPLGLRIILRKDRASGAHSRLPPQQETPLDKKHSIAVEIIRTPQITHNVTKAKAAPIKCRCHIDTQAPEQEVVHHNTQFTLCNVVEESDKQWHQGLYFRAEVRIRWHCSPQ